MNIGELRKICSQLPQAKEDIKWGNDLYFSLGKVLRNRVEPSNADISENKRREFDDYV